MAFYGYKGDFDDYSSPHSSAYGELNLLLLDYSSSAYYKDDDYSEAINYTCSYNYNDCDYSEPRFLQYDQVNFPCETKFTVSYSNVNVELNEAEFEEYDPTPYDGGYDQTMTYGKPLPPSDLTCYPRSLPKSDASPLDNFSYDSTPSPYGKDDPLPLPLPLPIKPPNATETESHVEENGGKDVEIVGYPSYEHQNGHQIPYGSGLEAMDICESIFGYWPCLAKKAQQQQQQQMNLCQFCDQMDPWKAAADYFFGTPLPYDYHNYNRYRSDHLSSLQ